MVAICCMVFAFIFLCGFVSTERKDIRAKCFIGTCVSLLCAVALEFISKI